MAGLYVHIPFCRDACSYCDFHFSISLGQLPQMLRAIQTDIENSREFLERETLETVYFGGGTPSVLPPAELETLLHKIRENYTLRLDAEISLEANPEDLDSIYLAAVRELGINRLSIGIQSFHKQDLLVMNRNHDPGRSKACLENVINAGFDNFNIDLIYGIPGQNGADWRRNLDTALEFRPTHLAAYHLSYENKTVLDYQRRKKRIQPVGEKTSLEQFRILCSRMNIAGYTHYEISNFALPGFISRHNSAYWTGKKYLGIGPSAHSFNGKVRRWNMARNSSYVRGIMNNETVYEEEVLDERSRFHEYLMTSLRTQWGTDLEYLDREWGRKTLDHVLKKAAPFIQSRRARIQNGRLILSQEGMFIADHIITALFL